MVHLQGGLLIASVCEILIGALGLVGFLLRFIGPITIGPVLIAIGVSLAQPAIGTFDQFSTLYLLLPK